MGPDRKLTLWIASPILRGLNLEILERLSRISVEALKEARMVLGISQYEVAKRSGVSRTMIHHMEIGRRNPTLITTHAVARALDLDLAIIMAKAGDEVSAQTMAAAPGKPGAREERL
jgi:transcriptional regulator with XRE-family HTH domain